MGFYRLPEKIFRQAIENDLLYIIKTELINNLKHKYIYIKISKLTDIFIYYYGFKYQIQDKVSVNKYDIIDALKRLDICSKFKFRGYNPRRCKIIYKKIVNHDKYNSI